MSFNDMQKDQLLEVAAMFGVEVKPTAQKPMILKALNDDGVEYERYVELTQPAEPPPVELALVDESPLEREVVIVEEEEPEVVIKMTRENRAFQIGRYKWTREHPYVLVRESDADTIMETEAGFRMATPKELREFYGG